LSVISPVLHFLHGLERGLSDGANRDGVIPGDVLKGAQRNAKLVSRLFALGDSALECVG